MNSLKLARLLIFSLLFASCTSTTELDNNTSCNKNETFCLKKTGQMSVPYFTPWAFLLKGNKVLVFGGVIDLEGSQIPKQRSHLAEIYDIETGQFQQIGKYKPRLEEQASQLDDGRVIISGGSSNNQPLSEIEVFNPSTMQFKLVGHMHDTRELHLSVALSDNTVLLAGGKTSKNHKFQRLNTAEIYDPKTAKSTRVGNLNVPRSAPQAIKLKDGRVLVCGGGNGEKYLNSAEIYNPSTKKFTLTGSMNTPRYGASMSLLKDGRVLVAGGSDDGFHYLDTVEVYDPISGKFSLLGSKLTTERAGHSALVLPDGRVLIKDGMYGTGPFPREPLPSDMEIYDPSVNKSVYVDLPVSRLFGSTMVLLNDKSQIFLAGAGGRQYFEILNFKVLHKDRYTAALFEMK